MEKILEITGYMESLKNEDSEDASSRIQNLHELINVAKEYSEMENPFQQFLDHIALRAETDDYDADAEITLMTLHNAKGLEFPVVYLAGCEDGLFPHSRAIIENDLEEERRLCYVGMTRAEQRLYLTYSRRRRFYGRDSDELNQPSRFLHEIPSKLVKIHESAPRYSQSGFNFGERSNYSGSGQFYTSKTRQPYQGNSYNSIESVKAFLNKRSTTGRKKSIVTGSVVEHERFGRGRVLKVEDTGSDLKVTVQFPGLGIKKLLQSYARLKRV
jgi:DNA helicase-2/ATP-dependent DNA helicase PcrA